MSAPIDIGLSVSGSSAAQAGDIETGDFLVGGSGGVNQTPVWVWIALAVLGAIVVWKFLVPPRR